jgi:hypothetical protein
MSYTEYFTTKMAEFSEKLEKAGIRVERVEKEKLLRHDEVVQEILFDCFGGITRNNRLLSVPPHQYPVVVQSQYKLWKEFTTECSPQSENDFEQLLSDKLANFYDGWKQWTQMKEYKALIRKIAQSQTEHSQEALTLLQKWSGKKPK